MASKDRGGFYPIAYASNLIRRVCRSTLQAETQALTSAVEEGCKLRAALCGMKGLHLRRGWEPRAAEMVRHIWLCDCRSLADHLASPVTGKVGDKRLSFDLHSLRQDLWSIGDEELEELKIERVADRLRWIDTSTMLVDCMTKSMQGFDLMQALRAGLMDLTATPLSVQKEMKKGQQRREKKVRISE